MATILFTKRSTWEQYHMEMDDNPQIARAMTKAGLKKLHESHLQHRWVVDLIHGELKRLKAKYCEINGAETAFVARPGDRVICVGGDGTVLAASHHCGPGVHLIAVNSNPEKSFGQLCNARPSDVYDAIGAKRPPVTLIPRMQVTVNDWVIHRRVLNEALFSDSCPAAMTRVTEGTSRYACSGLWIGTGVGSTGALQSAGGKVMPVRSRLLQTVVREPFNHKTTRALKMIRRKFEFVSKTVDATLFLDGSFLRVPVGYDHRMEFTISPEPLMMIGPPPK